MNKGRMLRRVIIISFIYDGGSHFFFSSSESVFFLSLVFFIDLFFSIRRTFPFFRRENLNFGFFSSSSTLLLFFFRIISSFALPASHDAMGAEQSVLPAADALVTENDAAGSGPLSPAAGTATPCGRCVGRACETPRAVLGDATNRLHTPGSADSCASRFGTSNGQMQQSECDRERGPLPIKPKCGKAP